MPSFIDSFTHGSSGAMEHQSQRQRVGAARDLRTHQRILPAEAGGIDFFQGVSAQIVVAVPGSRIETFCRNPVVLHGF